MTQVSEAHLTYLENQRPQSRFMLRMCNYYKYAPGSITRDYEREQREDEVSEAFNANYYKKHSVWLLDNQKDVN